jgi:hypothetical protein
MPPRLISSMISKPLMTRPGPTGGSDGRTWRAETASGVVATVADEAEWRAGSRVTPLASVHAGQISRTSAGTGSSSGCSQVFPHGQVRRRVAMPRSERGRVSGRLFYLITVTHLGSEYNTG